MNNLSVLGRIVGLMEKTYSFLFTLSKVIYVVMWRVCLWLKRLDSRLTEEKKSLIAEESKMV